MRRVAVVVCLVLLPLVLALPLVLGMIRRLDAARRCRRYGPLSLAALRLSDVELQRRYQPGAGGRFEKGFGKLRLE